MPPTIVKLNAKNPIAPKTAIPTIVPKFRLSEYPSYYYTNMKSWFNYTISAYIYALLSIKN